MKTSIHCISVLLLVAVVANCAVADNPLTTVNMKLTTDATTFDVVHAVATDAGGIPDNLKKYGKYLRRAGAENWKLEARKQTKPVPGSSKPSPCLENWGRRSSPSMPRGSLPSKLWTVAVKA